MKIYEEPLLPTKLFEEPRFLLPLRLGETPRPTLRATRYLCGSARRRIGYRVQISQIACAKWVGSDGCRIPVSRRGVRAIRMLVSDSQLIDTSSICFPFLDF